MIKKLSLRQFGKFRNRGFDFSKVTVFAGPNESGKSTVFDALFDCLCEPDARSVYGKRLKDRYGEERQADIDRDVDGPIDPYEFINIYAIQSGELDVNASNDRAWLDKVKSILFSGGVDPQKLSDDLKKETTSRRKESLLSLKNTLQKEIELLEANEQALWKRRNNLLEEEKFVEKSGEELNSVQKDIAKRRRELSAKQDILEEQKNIKIIKNRRRILTMISRLDSQKNELERMSTVSEDESEKLEELKSGIRKIEESRSRLQIEKENIEANLKASQYERASVQDERREAEKLSRTAAEFYDRLQGEHFKEIIQKKVLWRWPFLLISLFLLGGGVSALFFLSPPFGLISLIAAIVAAIVFVIISRKAVEENNTAEIDKSIADLKAEWKYRNPDALELQSSEPNLLRDELSRIRSHYDALVNKEDELRRKEQEILRRRDQYDTDLKKIEEELEKRKKSLGDWLEARAVKSEKDYYDRLRDYRSLAEKTAEIEKSLDAYLKDFGLNDLDELKSRCDADLRKLEIYQGIDQVPEEKLQRIEREASQLDDELQDLEDQKAELIKSHSRREGVFHANLGNIPEQIADVETTLDRKKAELEEIEVDVKATELASDIFQRIAADSTVGLENLAKDISDTFGGIISTQAEVKMSALDLNSAEAFDSGGRLRRIHNLSTGTKDAFLLASRLVLASKTEDEHRLIVLDEPFHSLDFERIQRVLKILREYSDKENRQLILFTKDDAMVQAAQELFDPILIHRLDHA